MADYVTCEFIRILRFNWDERERSFLRTMANVMPGHYLKGTAGDDKI